MLAFKGEPGLFDFAGPGNADQLVQLEIRIERARTMVASWHRLRHAAWKGGRSCINYNIIKYIGRFAHMNAPKRCRREEVY